jgi:predicted nucleic acid-binding protein
MIVYAETSAVLAWLFGEPRGRVARQTLSAAERVVSSTLTAIECTRAIERRLVAGTLSESDALIARQLFGESVRQWVVIEMTETIPARAARRFPREPLRSLDAIHLATAIAVRTEIPNVAILSFDERVRTNAVELGFALADG